MPKKLNPLTHDEQQRLFEEELRKRIAAGELSPTEADDALDAMVRKSIKHHGA